MLNKAQSDFAKRKLSRDEYSKCAMHVRDNKDEFCKLNPSEAARLLGQFIGRAISVQTTRSIYKSADVEWYRTRTGRHDYSGTPKYARELALQLRDICEQLGIEVRANVTHMINSDALERSDHDQ